MTSLIVYETSFLSILFKCSIAQDMTTAILSHLMDMYTDPSDISTVTTTMTIHLLHLLLIWYQNAWKWWIHWCPCSALTFDFHLFEYQLMFYPSPSPNKKNLQLYQSQWLTNVHNLLWCGWTHHTGVSKKLQLFKITSRFDSGTIITGTMYDHSSLSPFHHIFTISDTIGLAYIESAI